jgi:ferredoxin
MSAQVVLVVGSDEAALEAAREVVAQGGRAVLVRSPGARRQCALRTPSGIEVIEAELASLEGSPGRFRARLQGPDGDDMTVECSAVVLAPSPGNRATAEGGMSLEDMSEADVPEDVRSVAFVLPAGSPRPSFMKTVRMARELRARAVRPSVTVFAAEMAAYGTDEIIYRQAQADGVLFVRAPEAEVTFDPPRVAVRDRTTGEEIEVTPDLLVLGGRFDGDAEVLATGSFAVARGTPAMGVVATVREGILSPGREDERLETESITGARAAATRAMTVAMFPEDRTSRAAIVDRDRCAACLTCARVCPFGAARPGDEGKASIDAALCQSCGICVGACPGRALSLPSYGEVSDEGKMMIMGGSQ